VIRFSTAAALALLATTLSAQSLPTAWELALPNAKYLGAIDLRRVRESPFARTFESQLAGSVLQNGTITVRIPGIDRLNDFVKVTDRIFVSSTGAGSTPATEFLGVLEGPFQPLQLQALLQGSGTIYRGIGVYRLSTSGDLSVALLAQGIVLFGDEKSIFGALDRWGRVAPDARSGVLARVAALASRNDFWMFWPDFPSVTLPFGRKSPAEIEQIELGFTYRDAMGINMSYTLASEATAKKFAQFYSTLARNITPAQASQRMGFDLIRRSQVSSEGNRALLHISLTRENAAQLFETALTSLNPLTFTAPGDGQVPSFNPAASVTSSPKSEPESTTPKKIKIYGLEDGVKEIPVGRQ